MKDLNGTKTQANLLAAFAGESMARNKYTFYASKAKKEGFEQISGIFSQIADNERAHAKIWFEKLHGGIAETAANLLDAAEGEYAEWADMYKRFAIEAREEGFEDIATLFEKVGDIEQEHEQRYRQLLANLQEGKVFERPEGKMWICRNCGHIHFGTNAPQSCPVCKHPMSYFEIKAENY